MPLNPLTTKRTIGFGLMVCGLIIVAAVIPIKIWLVLLGILLIWYGYITVKSV